MPWAIRALGSRNFRLFFCGQIVSLCGSWITTTANAWLIYHLTGKNVLLGLSAFFAQIPAFFLAPFLGVMIDRWDVRRTIVVTQSLSLLQSAMLAGLCWSGVLPVQYMVGAIMGLQLFQGVINAIDLPARQSFGIQMVDRREDLPNAIALNSTMINVTRLVGPAIAGVVIAVGVRMAGSHPRAGELGAAICYTVDVVSYVGVIWALLIMTPREIARTTKRADFLTEFKEGLRYIAHYPALRTVLILQCFASFFGVSFNSQLAAIAKDTLKVGPDGYGLLVAGVGAGATVSAIFLATRRGIAGLPRVISYAATVFGLALMGLSFTRHYGVALLLAPVLGGAMILQSASTNTLMQTLSSDDKRGRVMAFFTMSFMGMAPLGALTLGAAAEWLSPGRALLGFGGVLLAAAVVAVPVLRRMKLKEPEK